ncbi:MAG: hypothetical protein JJ911_09520 [Rhizobiaceae bacterium]|nr:hypothetical protein [Rhizobiaceae bacterium]
MNLKLLRLVPFSLALALPSAQAQAVTSEWAGAEGGAVRIVTDGAPDETGTLRATLEIRLDPGWKTYWRDPGESGIPPMVEIETPHGAADIDIGFPVPRRHHDGYSTWVGYDYSVSLALTITLPPDHGDKLSASVLVGVCDQICIPLAAELGLDLADESNAKVERLMVESAFAALPRAAETGFAAWLREASADHIVIDAEVPAADAADLFVASTENWVFGVPEQVASGPSPVFKVPVVLGPKSPGAGEPISYVLVSGEDAVAGTFEISR